MVPCSYDLALELIEVTDMFTFAALALLNADRREFEIRLAAALERLDTFMDRKAAA